jgi:branched-chain amino acid transport system permease protein
MTASPTSRCWRLLAAGPAPLLGLYPVFVMKLLCFALFACAFNLLLGFTGLLSFGHAAFFGFAAYVTGWLHQVAPGLDARGRHAWAAPSLAALLGLLVGLVAIRRQGIYFAMITLAMAQMVYFHLPAGAVHRRRRRPAGRAARQLFGLLPLASTRPCTTWWWRSL